ncbi:MAG: NUDIX domain-containing protein [Anaerolineae bacterium]|nr:NUDIX domain-containing protein [Anaerolineae bacterium]
MAGSLSDSLEGDWAWTPPSGALYPGEDVVDCAKRELFEETGLQLELVPVAREQDDWKLFLARSSGPVDIHLSEEHDQYICKSRMIYANCFTPWSVSFLLLLIRLRRTTSCAHRSREQERKVLA